VKINDKHIEVIVRQMLQKVEITTGESTFLVGEQVDRDEFEARSTTRSSPRAAVRRGPAGAAGHHQGQPADPLVHLGGLLPGDHPGAHRGGGTARRPPDPSRRTSSSAA
jgi:hypothetical protein